MDLDIQSLELDDFEAHKKHSSEDEGNCEKHYRETVQRDNSERFIVTNST